MTLFDHGKTTRSDISPVKQAGDLYSISAQTYQQLPAEFCKPEYDLNSRSPGILHFGLGNFHRAHQAYYLHRLFNKGLDLDWAVIGAGVFEAELGAYNALMSQDLLYSLVQRSSEEVKAYLVGSIADYIKPCDMPAILGALKNPDIHIVSLTITEGGYFLDPNTGAFDIDDESIRSDLANPDAPQTVFGLILAGLKYRFSRGVQPFTVMSCDNIPHNGDVTRSIILGMAESTDRSLSGWIDKEVCFPNSMVDRITPATGEYERNFVQQELGVRDVSPVFCEDFIQWILEDKFSNGRPRFEEVGVQFVEDVSPFETMKIRILNGGHAMIAYPAALMGIQFVHEAMQNELILGFFHKLQKQEVLPIIPDVPGVDLNAYLDQIGVRFANPNIKDTIERLCYDGANRQPKFILPTISDQLAGDAKVLGLSLATAFWCRYCAGVDEAGANIAPNDPTWAYLNQAAMRAKESPEYWLDNIDLYEPVRDHYAFRKEFCYWLDMIWRDGTAMSLQSYLDMT